MEAYQWRLLGQFVHRFSNVGQSGLASPILGQKDVFVVLLVYLDVADPESVLQDSNISWLVMLASELDVAIIFIAFHVVADEREWKFQGVYGPAISQADLNSREVLHVFIVPVSGVALDVIESHAWLKVSHQLGQV